MDPREIKSQPFKNLFEELSIPKPEEIETLKLQIQAGDKLYDEGKYPDAFNAYSQILEKNFGNIQSLPSYHIMLLHQLGIASMNKGAYAEGDNFLMKAIEMKKNIDPKDFLGISLISIRTSLAEVYLNQARYSEARQILNEALTYYEQHPEGKTQEIVKCLNLLADLSKSEGHFSESLKYLNKAIKIAGTSNNISKELTNSYYLMGTVYYLMSNYSPALMYAKKAKKMRKELYGPRHPEIAMSYNTIGHIHRHQSNLEKALKYYNKALNIRLEFLGNFHPYVAGCYTNIGLVNCMLQDYERALENYIKCVEVEIVCYGEDHPEVAESYSYIGDTLNSQGFPLKALEYHRESLNIRLKSLGPKHYNVANSYNDLGIINNELNRFFEAFQNFFYSLRIQLDYIDEDYSKITYSLRNLSYLFGDLRNWNPSESFTKKLKIVLEKSEGKEDHTTQNCLENIKILERTKTKIDYHIADI